MARKYIPTEEELKEILSYYSVSGSYQEVARRTGLNAPVIKRIIDENSDKKKEFSAKNYSYSGFPPEEPDIKQILNFNEELERLKTLTKNRNDLH